MIEVKRERERAGDAANTASITTAMMWQASAVDSEDEDDNTPIAQIAYKAWVKKQMDAMIRVIGEREEKLKAQQEEECTQLLDKQAKKWSQLKLKNEKQLHELENKFKREREKRQQAQQVENVQREERQAEQSVAQQPPVEEQNQQLHEEEVTHLSETELRKRQEVMRVDLLMIAAFASPEVVQRDGLVTKTEHPADTVSAKRKRVLMEKNEQKSSRQKIVDSPSKKAKETMELIECSQVDARPLVCKKGQEKRKDIQLVTGATIAVTTAGDQCKIQISGSGASVDRAIKLVRDHMQREITIECPKEVRKYFLGKGGAVIKKVEKAVGAKISPKTSGMSFNLIITGRNESMNQAKTSIVKLLDEYFKRRGKMINVEKR